MKHKAIFIIGPESSGTRLATRLFMEAGCDGDDKHKQKLDKLFKNPNSNAWPDKSIVFRRSVPHDGKWYLPTNITNLLREKGYLTQTVITVREHFSNIKSKINNNHSKAVTAEEDLQKQLGFIFQSFFSTNESFYVLCTSQLMKDKFFVLKSLYKYTGFLLSDARIREIVKTIYDADLKHRE